MRSSVFSARIVSEPLRSVSSTVWPLFSTVTVTWAAGSCGKNLSSLASFFSARSIKLCFKVTRRPVHVTFIGKPPLCAVPGGTAPHRPPPGALRCGRIPYLYYSKLCPKSKNAFQQKNTKFVKSSQRQPAAAVTTERNDMDKLTALQTYFGHSAFRPGQEPIIDALTAGRDVLAVMPTGAGKSACYQIPAVLLGGVTLVISPLISLMQDQVAALREEGIPAACLHSGQDEETYRALVQQALGGAFRILYAAPERLETESFVALSQRLDVRLVAVDEAHCVSQWGQDFRPSYLKIAAFLARLPRRPAVGAFHGHRDRTGPPGHHPPARPAGPPVPDHRLRPPQPLLCGRPPARQRTLYRRIRPRPPRQKRHRLLRHAQKRRKPLPASCRPRASGPPATTPGWRPKNAPKTRRISSTTAAASWSRPTRSAWASTNRTSALCCTTTCPRTSKTTTRRPGAPGATAQRPSASCCSLSAISRPRAIS